jgi:hypothetical protein
MISIQYMKDPYYWMYYSTTVLLGDRRIATKASHIQQSAQLGPMHSFSTVIFTTARPRRTRARARGSVSSAKMNIVG